MKTSHDTDLDTAARRFSALGHRRRLEILIHLSTSGGCSCGDVVAEVDLAQSTISQHLKQLVEAGLVRHSACGQRSLYAVDREALGDLLLDLTSLSACCRKEG